MAKVGRPTKYTGAMCRRAYKLCLLNMTDEQLASALDIGGATLSRWKNEYPKFREAIKKGKVIADAEVGRALFQRATGYSHPEDKIFCTDGGVTRVKTIKHYPPDTAAAFIWLKNRAGWKDKQTQEHEVSEDTAKLLGLIDGGTKGRIPQPEDAG